MPEYKTKRNDFLKEEYYEYTHESGLPVYVFPKKLSTSYALFATRYGSIDSRFRLAGDKEFTTVPDGIAHYLEHKMFENPNGEGYFRTFREIRRERERLHLDQHDGVSVLLHVLFQGES